LYCEQFSENAELRRKLLGTGDERIIFACKTDRFLGSGCSAEELSETKTYHGKNWLGKSLMKLRGKLQVSVGYHWLLFVIVCMMSIGHFSDKVLIDMYRNCLLLLYCAFCHGLLSYK